jgi:hypothetical protein
MVLWSGYWPQARAMKITCSRQACSIFLPGGDEPSGIAQQDDLQENLEGIRGALPALLWRYFCSKPEVCSRVQTFFDSRALCVCTQGKDDYHKKDKA